MKEELVAYFAAEKWGALILVVAAVAALATAAALVATKSTYRGMALPLAILGLVELVIGGVLLARTDGQVAALLNSLAVAPGDMARAELARMAPVMRTFTIVLIGEVVVLSGGLVLTYIAGRSDFLYALGVGLVAQAGVLLVFNLFAVRRAAHYVDLLRALGS